MNETRIAAFWKSLLLRIVAILAATNLLVFAGFLVVRLNEPTNLLFGATVFVVWFYSITLVLGGRSAISSLFPYRNVYALVAYYCGVASIVPLVGLLFCIPAVVFGRLGLKAWRRHPRFKGRFHAWFGILAGVSAVPISAIVYWILNYG